jgi:hypothetical protein
MLRARNRYAITLIVFGFALFAGCSTEPGSGDGNSADAGAEASVDADGADVDASDRNCGELGQLCCPNQTCRTGLACTGIIPNVDKFRCATCGVKNGPCCGTGMACESGLFCRTTVDTGRRCSDIPPFDAACVLGCFPVGGQYCEQIGDNCGHTLECGACTQPGFTCGGSGYSHVCGASRDSGACTPPMCETPAGRYCGMIGDGCGAYVDCGGCGPNADCGGSGIANLCGRPPAPDCKPSGCSSESIAYCGRISDGCGHVLDCGDCPAGQTCGELTEHVCGRPIPDPPPPPRGPPPYPPPPPPPPPPF